MTTRLVLGFVGERRGEAAVARVLERAQIAVAREELESDSTWVSYDARIRLFEAAVEEVGEPEVMFRIGGSGVRQSINAPTSIMLRALGSPRDVFAQLPRAVPKFTTTSTMRMLEVGATHAVFDYQLHDGYEHSRLDCQYAQGLFTIVPELFGLPPAQVVHEQCQSDGAPSCLYEVHWAPRSRLPWRRRRERQAASTLELRTLRAQVKALQSAAADLVSSDDLDTVLQRIVERAASAVLAQSYVLAVNSPSGGPPHVHAVGLSAREAQRLAPQLLCDEGLGPHAVVVDVVSARKFHGRLAAMYSETQSGLPAEREHLAAYARHAAAALDNIIALEQARRGEQRAHALLRLANALARVVTPEEVARGVVAALPGIVNADRISVMLWDKVAGELVPAAAEGLTSEQYARWQNFRLRPSDSPELANMLRDPRPALVKPADVTPALRHMLDAAGSRQAAVMPMLSDGRLLGVVSCNWSNASGHDLDELFERLRGVANLATPALLNAELVAAAHHQSEHDVLTGLPNRQLFANRVASLATKPTPGQVGLVFCDLDGFKQINDSFGHAAGDEVLRQDADRLAATIREGDVLARLSGDEFVVLLPDLHDTRDADQVIERLSHALEPPLTIEGRAVQIGASIGLAVSDRERLDADILMREADAAMYRVKREHHRRAGASVGA